MRQAIPAIPSRGWSRGIRRRCRAQSGLSLHQLLRHRGIEEAIQHFVKKGWLVDSTKRTCFAIYSRCVNSEIPVEQVLGMFFPWCSRWAAELKQLFASCRIAPTARIGGLSSRPLVICVQGARGGRPNFLLSTLRSQVPRLLRGGCRPSWAGTLRRALRDRSPAAASRRPRR